MAHLIFWFPAEAEPGTGTGQRLKSRRNWNALVWFVVYMLGWMVLLALRPDTQKLYFRACGRLAMLRA